MTWTASHRRHRNIRIFLVAGVFLASPPIAATATASAAPGADAKPPAVVAAPLPADPPPPPPPAPAQQPQGEYYNPGDQDDWWVYSGTGSF